MIHFSIRLFLLPVSLTVTSALLSGCQSLTPPPIVAKASPTEAAIQKLRFACSGKLFIRYSMQGKEQQLPGRFDWTQSENSLDIQLYSSPLGQTVARIHEEGGQAILEQPGKSSISSENLDQLLLEVLRYPFPVSGMKEWLQARVKNPDGRAVTLSPEDQTVEQDGWKLRFVSWHAAGKPKRIDISRYTEQAGEVIIQLVLDAEE